MVALLSNKLIQLVSWACTFDEQDALAKKLLTKKKFKHILSPGGLSFVGLAIGIRLFSILLSI